MSEFGTLESRVRRKSLLSKVMKPEDTVKFFTPGQNLVWSGFTPAGYPKVVPIALANHVEQNKLQGQWKFNLFIGASVGVETENRWATLDMIDRRWPYQTGKDIAAGINAGRIRMGDKHLGHFAQDISYGFYTENGRYDIGIIEVSAITEDCGLALTTSCGIVAEAINLCDKIILEVNTGQPSFEGIHDIHMQQKPPHRAPFLITEAHTRIGTPYVPCDPDKIIAIVESKLRDKGRAFAEMDDTSDAIAGHIMDFFAHEIKRGRLPENLLPLQSGVGSIANAVIGGLAKGPFHNLSVYTEVLQDTMLDFFDGGNLNYASACSLSLSEDPGFPRFFDNWDKYFGKCILRPLSISNAPEPIRRLGCIAMNTPVEVDMYAHANSTLVGGTRMINGLGGSGDYLRNGFLKIMHTPSSRPSKTDPTGISCVVPHCSHIDHTEHDLDCIVTEQGLADLRGLCPRDRALKIIEKCAHPDYKPILTDYYKMAKEQTLSKGIGHEPQLWDRAFKMHLNLAQNGTMKIKNWDVKMDLCE